MYTYDLDSRIPPTQFAIRSVPIEIGSLRDSADPFIKQPMRIQFHDIGPTRVLVGKRIYVIQYRNVDRATEVPVLPRQGASTQPFPTSRAAITYTPTCML